MNGIVLATTFVLTIGSDPFDTGQKYPVTSMHGQVTMTKGTDGVWTGIRGSTVYKVSKLGQSYSLSIEQMGKVLGTNTNLDSPNGKPRWRVGVMGGTVMVQ
jgi:hypothetical protein